MILEMGDSMKRILILSTVLFWVIGLNTSSIFAATQSGTTGSTVTFAGGALTLNSVPNTFNFGSVSIGTSTTTQPLSAGNNYILTVTDTRGLLAGYHVTVSAPVLTSGDGSKLNGNNIRLTNPTTQLVGTGLGLLPPVVNQTFYADAVDGLGSPVPSTVSTSALNTLQGGSQWQIIWPGNNVNLIVQPGEAQAKQYSTTITWTLYDTP